MNHYEVLGLIPSVEQPVIRAAYKALVNIYHPDKNPPENKDFIKKINIAYEVLSDPRKKKEYDSKIEKNNDTASSLNFSSTPPYDTNNLSEGWSLAISFYPNIKLEFNILKNISWNLAHSFKLELLENKDFSNSAIIFKNKKFNYLSTYFGSDNQIVDYAEKLILIDEVDAALELNRMIKTMGQSVSKQQLEKVIDNKYPKANGRIAYFKLKAEIGKEYGARYELMRIEKAEIKNVSIFSTKQFLLINNKRFDFVDPTALDEFLINYLKDKYEKA